jgi:hypothetical protein
VSRLRGLVAYWEAKGFVAEAFSDEDEEVVLHHPEGGTLTLNAKLGEMTEKEEQER